MVEFFESSLGEFVGVTKKPQTFLSSTDDENPTTWLKGFLKRTYDFVKSEENDTEKSCSGALPELIVQDFDLEQIWQQLELQNDSVLKQSLTDVSNFIIGKDGLLFFNENHDGGGDGEDDDCDGGKIESVGEESVGENAGDESEDEFKKSDDSDLVSSDESATERKKESISTKGKSIVDDEFFKLSEMEDFLNAEEKKLNKKTKTVSESDEEEDDDESVDLFKEDDCDDGEEIMNPKYKEFFGAGNEQLKKSKKRNKFFESAEFSDSDAENAENDSHDKNNSDEEAKIPKSSFELRKERMTKKIEDIENVAISEKPWQLKGEITADKRPQNSLLEEVVEFDLTTRPAPVITEETTHKLEDIIRQRIKDRTFDSVVRKEKPVESVLEYKKKLVLDQEKSKESLAQIYEKEYLKQKEALDPNADEREPEVPELHKEIEAMMNSLFVQLDALSNFHFTPKPAAPELRVVTNLPAISMEEVAPVATSDATLLAPEEIKARPRGDVMGKSERTATDKKRERRKKKKKQKIHANAKLKKDVGKMKLGLGNKYSKEKAKQMLKDVTRDKNVDKMDESAGKPVKSSKAFFTQLQEEVQTQIHNKVQAKRKKNQMKLSAKKIKL